MLIRRKTTTDGAWLLVRLSRSFSGRNSGRKGNEQDNFDFRNERACRVGSKQRDCSASRGINVLLALSAITLRGTSVTGYCGVPRTKFQTTFVPSVPERSTFTPPAGLCAPTYHKLISLGLRGKAETRGVRRMMCSSSLSGTSTGALPAHLQALIKFKRDTPEWHICESLLRSLQPDPAQTDKMSRLEQGTVEWLGARRFRLTGSNFGAAAGRNPYTNRSALVQEMLEPKFTGNDATRHGNKMEPIARDCYIEKKRKELALERGEAVLDDVDFTVTESGLHIWDQLPFLAVSPDGHVHEYGKKGLLEIKCPFYKKSMDEIPEYYLDQVQGLMAILGYEWADFVVCIEENVTIRRIPFDKNYWVNSLLPALKSFYSDMFLPAYVQAQLQRSGQVPVRSNDNAAQNLQLPASNFVGQTSSFASTPSASQTNRAGAARPKPVVSVISVAPASYSPASAGGTTFIPADQINSGPVAAMAEGSLLTKLLTVVRQLDLSLRPLGLRPEYVGSGPNSLFLALVKQLHPLGLLDESYDTTPSIVDGVSMQMPRAADKARAQVLRYIALNTDFFEKEWKVKQVQVRHRLADVGAGRVRPNGVELWAAAYLYNVNVVCFTVSENGILSQTFNGRTPETAPTIYMCWTESLFWSTRPYVEPDNQQPTQPNSMSSHGETGMSQAQQSSVDSKVKRSM